MMTTPRRSLRDLRTLSGRTDPVSLPYRAYMRVTWLEMEKVRRNSERQSASRRIAGIDARLKEIETEKATLLQAAESLRENRVARTPVLDLRPAPRRNAGGFKLRY